jgi:hypothetical protein
METCASHGQHRRMTADSVADSWNALTTTGSCSTPSERPPPSRSSAFRSSSIFMGRNINRGAGRRFDSTVLFGDSAIITPTSSGHISHERIVTASIAMVSHSHLCVSALGPARELTRRRKGAKAQRGDPTRTPNVRGTPRPLIISCSANFAVIENVVAVSGFAPPTGYASGGPNMAQLPIKRPPLSRGNVQDSGHQTAGRTTRSRLLFGVYCLEFGVRPENAKRQTPNFKLQIGPRTTA